MHVVISNQLHVWSGTMLTSTTASIRVYEAMTPNETIVLNSDNEWAVHYLVIIIRMVVNGDGTRLRDAEKLGLAWMQRENCHRWMGWELRLGHRRFSLERFDTTSMEHMKRRCYPEHAYLRLLPASFLSTCVNRFPPHWIVKTWRRVWWMKTIGRFQSWRSVSCRTFTEN